MKKGFLFSSSSKGSSASETTKSTKIVPAGCDQKEENENIPFITARKDSTDSQHRFDEVQQAIQVSDAFAINKGDVCVLMEFAFLQAFHLLHFVIYLLFYCLCICIVEQLSIRRLFLTGDILQ